MKPTVAAATPDATFCGKCWTEDEGAILLCLHGPQFADQPRPGWYHPRTVHASRPRLVLRRVPGFTPRGRRHISDELRLAVYERDGYNCLHCGTNENLSLDHIHPYSRGGEDTLRNLQTLCRSCNSRKGARV